MGAMSLPHTATLDIICLLVEFCTAHWLPTGEKPCLHKICYLRISQLIGHMFTTKRHLASKKSADAL